MKTGDEIVTDYGSYQSHDLGAQIQDKPIAVCHLFLRFEAVTHVR